MRVDLMGSIPISRSPLPCPVLRRSGSVIASHLLGHLRPLAPGHPPAKRGHPSTDRDRNRAVQERRGPPEGTHDDRILEDHLARNITQEAASQPYDPDVAIHKAGEEPCAPDDDR